MTHKLVNDVIKLPIRTDNDVIQTQIADVVSNVQTQKQSNPAADTSALEAEIDRMIYELYGLTEDEIKIVEREKR